MRCDGRRPNCDRCAANEKMCAYPTRRRSRNTQPTDVDPFIDDLSQLETRIRAIESEQEALWDLMQRYDTSDDLVPRMVMIDQEVQTSRASLARQRLLREQHIARSKQSASDKAKQQQQQQQQHQQQSRKKSIKEEPIQHHQQTTTTAAVATPAAVAMPQHHHPPPPPPPACAVQSPWDEMFPTLAWPPTTQPGASPQPKEWFDQPPPPNQQAQRLQPPTMYASSSTSTASSGSPPFHPPNDMMMDSYELMNFVMDEESLMTHPHDTTNNTTPTTATAPWLGHPRL